MISQFHRFHGHASLKRVYQRGTTIRGAHANLKFLFRGDNKPYRVAVVVSRKVSKSAVVRNRIRRRIYELVRQAPEPIPAGLDLVILVYNEELAKQQYEELTTAVTHLLQKAIQTKSELEKSHAFEP